MGRIGVGGWDDGVRIRLCAARGGPVFRGGTGRVRGESLRQIRHVPHLSAGMRGMGRARGEIPGVSRRVSLHNPAYPPGGAGFRGDAPLRERSPPHGRRSHRHPARRGIFRFCPVRCRKLSGLRKMHVPGRAVPFSRQGPLRHGGTSTWWRSRQTGGSPTTMGQAP